MSEPKRALILAGGGLKVAAQAGALQVWLDEAGLTFDHADGCSGGTLNLAMYCQGLSGAAIAANWRGYRPLSSLALNWPRALTGPWAPSLLTLDRLRDRQLPRWGLDWDRIHASPRSATFNVYDFSAHELLGLSPAEMTADLLMACVALPGWFPPLRLGRARLIDSVYATDANLTEAIRRGADELWVIWTVDRSGRWRPGWLAGYFQVIEASANSHLAEALRVIEENNAEVAAGRPGAYGRRITVRMLELAVPLHYLLVFRRAAMAAAVEVGVAGARAWCRREGLELRPDRGEEMVAAQAPELRFSESMAGTVGFTQSSTAAAGGALRDHRLALRLQVAIPDLARFLHTPQHRAALAGTVECQALGGSLPVSAGTLDLLALDEQGVTTMRYSLTCTDPLGRELLVEGHKTLRHDADLDLWSDTTTLTTTVTGPDGDQIAAGVVRLSLPGLLRLVATLRGRGRGVTGFWPVLRFGAFFLGRLARLYLAPVATDARAARRG
jgi:predicted acylesterase/phospholipase RssA